VKVVVCAYKLKLLLLSVFEVETSWKFAANIPIFYDILLTETALAYENVCRSVHLHGLI
jgi:hypothetical protein